MTTPQFSLQLMEEMVAGSDLYSNLPDYEPVGPQARNADPRLARAELARATREPSHQTHPRAHAVASQLAALHRPAPCPDSMQRRPP